MERVNTLTSLVKFIIKINIYLNIKFKFKYNKKQILLFKFLKSKAF